MQIVSSVYIGFCRKWVNWIKGCLKWASISIL